jgi:hypothetical protein
MAWKPTKFDITWSENLIRVMKQDGVWSTKDGLSVYKFDHKNKTLIAVLRHNSELHERIQIVFSKLGWSVDDSAPPFDPERN